MMWKYNTASKLEGPEEQVVAKQCKVDATADLSSSMIESISQVKNRVKDIVGAGQEHLALQIRTMINESYNEKDEIIAQAKEEVERANRRQKKNSSHVQSYKKINSDMTGARKSEGPDAPRRKTTDARETRKQCWCCNVAI
jgi:hypothetical protein